MNKKSLLSRILDRLKGGDDAKVNKFITRFEKYLKKQIQNRQENIEKQKDKMVDIDDKISEAAENIDVDQLGDTDSIDSYIVRYTKRQNDLLEEKAALQDIIDNDIAEIARLEEIYNASFPKKD